MRVRNLLFAYLDAGSGSLILQMLVGGFAGVVALFRYRWRSFRRQNPEAAEIAEGETGNTPT